MRPAGAANRAPSARADHRGDDALEARRQRRDIAGLVQTRVYAVCDLLGQAEHGRSHDRQPHAIASRSTRGIALDARRAHEQICRPIVAARLVRSPARFVTRRERRRQLHGQIGRQLLAVGAGAVADDNASDVGFGDLRSKQRERPHQIVLTLALAHGAGQEEQRRRLARDAERIAARLLASTARAIRSAGGPDRVRRGRR